MGHVERAAPLSPRRVGTALAPFALALVVAGAAAGMGGCKQTPPPPPRSSAASPPAPEIALATSRFVLVLNPFVELAATRAATRSDAGPDGGAHWAPMTALAACSDQACARIAFGGDEGALQELPEFLRKSWANHVEQARPAMDGAVTLLGEAEEVLSTQITKALGFEWPDEPVKIVVTAAGSDGREVDPFEDASFEAGDECFAGAAFLECAFEHAARVAGGQSGVLGAVQKEREQLDAAGKEATKSLARAVAMHAVGAAVHGVSRAYVPGRHFQEARREDERARAWLGREWGKRESGEERAEEIGKRLVRETAGR